MATDVNDVVEEFQKADIEAVSEKTTVYPNDHKNNDITPIPIDVDNFDTSNRTFAVFLNPDVPQHVIDDIVDIGKMLFEKWFVYRQTGENMNKLVEGLEQKLNKRTEIYTPFKNANKNVNALIDEPTKESHQTAATLFPFYAISKEKGVNPIVRNFLARDTQRMLGQDMKTPLTLAITYSVDGCDTASTIDFKTTGLLQGVITSLETLKIPQYNLGNPKSKERLIDYIEKL